MTARDEILNRLRHRVRPADPPAPWSSRRHFADLREQFATALTAAKGEAFLAACRGER